MAGAMIGSVTTRNAFHGGQPRSTAASSRLVSKVRRRDCTTTVTKHVVSVVWASAMVQKPRSTLRATNSISNDSPVITSGITSGA